MINKNQRSKPILGFVLLFVLSSVAAAEFPSGKDLAESDPMIRRTLIHDNIEREYFTFLPTTADEDRVPLVIALHGYFTTSTGFEAIHGVNQHAAKERYMVVYPQGSHFLARAGSGSPVRVTSWNDLTGNASLSHCTVDTVPAACPPECGQCDRCDWVSCHDDLGFIDAMIDAMLAEFPVDPDRIYTLGVSNGGMMALSLGCNLSERFAAVASIIAQPAVGYECQPTQDVPMLHLYGALDQTIPYDGRPSDTGYLYASAADTASAWAKGLNCKQGPVPWSHPIAEDQGLHCSAYQDCRASAQQVVGCMDPGEGHWWPGQRVEGNSARCVSPEQFDSMPGQIHCQPGRGPRTSWGMELVWDFMRRYSRSNSAAKYVVHPETPQPRR